MDLEHSIQTTSEGLYIRIKSQEFFLPHAYTRDTVLHYTGLHDEILRAIASNGQDPVQKEAVLDNFKHHQEAERELWTWY